MIRNWFTDNWIEITGAVTGIIYLFFSIKQKIWLWPWGIITSSFYVMVFYQSRLYADMSLNAYYVLVSIYGWFHWIYGNDKKDSELPVSSLSKFQWIYTLTSILLLWMLLWQILIRLPILFSVPAPDVPFFDAFITASSIVATYLLARKKIEQWLLWILIDAVSIGLFIYKGLYPTVFLFLFYTILAIFGYYEWKKVTKKIH